MPTPRLARTAIVAGAATALTLTVLAAPAYAAPAITLNTPSGPSGGGNAITGTIAATTAYPSPLAAGTTPVVQLQYIGTGASTCATAPKPVTQIAANGTTTTAGALTVNPNDVYRLSGTRFAFTVPSAAYPDVDGNNQPSTVNPDGLVLLPNQSSSKWSVCLYDAVSNVLIANGTYTLAPRPKITSIVPAASPALGGKTITVNGAGFVSGTTSATVGGSALKEIKVSPTGTSFTAVTPTRTAGDTLTLSVTTPGGTVLSTDPDNNGQPEDNDSSTADAPLYFAFTNGAVVTPRTAPGGASVSLGFQAAGVGALNFDQSGAAAPTDATAHIFLVRDAYLPDSNRGVQECLHVVVIDNDEVVCTLDLTSSLDPVTSAFSGNPVPDGTYTVTAVADGSTTATPQDANATIISSDATFTVGPY
ncbi:IPT/TIG domain-containing protein [Paractinoplanes lichenicola]|uniref:IPT/TIG domain-containing protein n=1 Tax=Paractinoplanes lichenicola TaxID=2802976 RepID=A0ABS1VHX4_9ACTN|nr:IPT/TIG domain-containing protein [Actinoplanes lichenicola]MBL7254312.1 IPT/TIG domain-containing protein [Actinoplanes lichenicola]